jgi:hypothetical protein
MLEAFFHYLKGTCQVENLLAVLNGDDAARRKALAVPRPVHLVKDRHFGIAGADEVSMERMTDPVFGHRAVSGRKRLRNHLPAEHALPACIGAVAAEKVLLDGFKVEELNEIFCWQGHDRLSFFIVDAAENESERKIRA